MSHPYDYWAMPKLYRGWPWFIYKNIFFEEHVDSGLTDVQFWIIIAALRDEDEPRALMFLNDWRKIRRRPTVEIGRFIPGQHFYVLGEKFWSYADAEAHAKKNGYDVSRLNEVRTFKEGD